MKQRKPGGQPGNQNAAKPPAARARKVVMYLYPRHIALAEEIADYRSTNRSAAIRWAIAEAAARLGVSGEERDRRYSE